MFFRKINYGFLILFVLILSAACSRTEQEVSVNAEQSVATSKQMVRFGQLGDEVYIKTLKGDYLEARQEIIQMTELLPQMKLEGLTTSSGIKTLADTLQQAIKVFNAVQLNTEEALFQSARIRLMADALSHPSTPLWLQYNKVFQEQVHEMEQVNKQKKYEELKSTFFNLKTLYLSLKPALQVSLQEDEASKLESAFQFMLNELQSYPLKSTNLNHGIKGLHNVIDDLFQTKVEATAYLPFMEPNEPTFHWMIVLAAIIMIILSYTAWRMRAARNDIITIQRKI
jgi:sporulation protein YpjB